MLKPRFLKNAVSVRVYLLGLAALIALPVVVFIALLLHQLDERQTESAENAVERAAAGIATATDLIIRDMESTIELVASAPELETGDFSEFHYRTRIALRGTGKFVIVLDETGQQLVNTRVTYDGAKLGLTSDLASLSEALRTGTTQISNVFFGKVSQRWVFNVVKPLPDIEGATARALIITKNAEELAGVLNPSTLPEGWHGAIVDSSNVVVTDVGPEQYPAGTPLELAGLRKFEKRAGVLYAESQGMGDIMIGYALVPGTKWHAMTWGPVEAALPSIFENWGVLIVGGVICIALAVLVTFFAGSHLRASVRGLSVMATELGEGEIVSPIRSGIREFDTVANALSSASFDRSQAESHIHFVMKELTHRKKNLIAVVISMVRQTARESDDMTDMRSMLEQRLLGLDRSIDLLTRHENRTIPLAEVAGEHLKSFTMDQSQVSIHGPEIELSPAAVQHLGMAFHELGTNSTKYGALGNVDGRLVITWFVSETPEGQRLLTVKWDERGKGSPNAPSTEGFGSRIIKDHMEAVFRGAVEIDYGPDGLVWSVTGPLSCFNSELYPEADQAEADEPEGDFGSFLGSAIKPPRPDKAT